MQKAYELYLQTSRLDLDDYNMEVEEGLHITSMAGTWMSIVEGFGGLAVIDDQLHINPKLPEAWNAFSFKLNFRGTVIKVGVSKENVRVTHGNPDLIVYFNGNAIAS
jgi:maltose phosphorylase